MMSPKVTFTAIALISVTAVGSTPASAGFKLFGGKGALIRGSVGKFVEKKVNPVATPILRVGTAVALPGIGSAVNEMVK